MGDIVFSGVAKFDESMHVLNDRAVEAARQIVTKGSLILTDNMKKRFRSRPSGSARTSSRTGRRYFAGAPDFPAVPPDQTVRTGNTKNSIRPRKIAAIGLDTWMSQTGPGTNYEAYPELGTSRIKVPFPIVKNGLKDSEMQIRELADVEFAKAML